MKATGIVRSVDNLGRIVVPKEIRRELGWTDGTPIEVFIDDEGEGVVLRTYDPDHMKALQTVREEILDRFYTRPRQQEEVKKHFDAIMKYLEGIAE